jgi:SAM-dependent methyltransferase
MQERASFDEYAGEYDNHFTYSNIGKLQRARVWHYLSDYLEKPLNILEINCGTGYDALQLAKQGHKVTATDASANMIEVGKARQANEPAKTKLYFEQSKFSELKDKLKGQKFDLVFSNFGGLNCIDKNEMKQLSSDLAQLLTQDAKLFFVIMGRKCYWERMYFTLKGDKTKANRRSKLDVVDTTINNSTFNTWYYSPKEIEELFDEQFSVEMIRPIGLFVPPSYLEEYFAKHSTRLKILSALENTFAVSVLSNYADHFVIQLNRA